MVESLELPSKPPVMKRRLSRDVDEAWNEVPGYCIYDHRLKMNSKGENSNYDIVSNI